MSLRPTKRIAGMAIALASIASGAVGESSASAAISGYRVTAGAGLTMRGGPGTGYASRGLLAYNTSVDINCGVTNGEAIGGNRTWHQLTNGNWVTDYWLNTPTYSTLLSGEPVCGTSTPNPTGSTAASRAALTWARARVGETWISNSAWRKGPSAYEQSSVWSGWCMLFAWDAYRFGGGVGAATGSAKQVGDAYAARLSTSTTPPAGALVFWAGSAANGWNGHVAIATGNGTEVVGTWGGGSYGITANRYYNTTTPIGAAYRGWVVLG